MKYETTSYNTKRMIADSLKSAMETQPFHKISVSELIRRCGINRKTFYYHFQDIYDLLRWMLAEEAMQHVKHFDLLQDHEAALRFVMDYVSENNYIINCACDSISRDEMRRFFYSDFSTVIGLVIDGAEEHTGKHIDPDFKAYITKFYTEAIASMLIDWAREAKRGDKEKTLRYLTNIISAAVDSMLQHMDGM